MVILSMCSYWIGYKKYVKYEEEKNESHYKRALLFFRMFPVFCVIGIVILFIGYLVRVM